MSRPPKLTLEERRAIATRIRLGETYPNGMPWKSVKEPDRRYISKRWLAVGHPILYPTPNGYIWEDGSPFIVAKDFRDALMRYLDGKDPNGND